MWLSDPPVQMCSWVVFISSAGGGRGIPADRPCDFRPSPVLFAPTFMDAEGSEALVTRLVVMAASLIGRVPKSEEHLPILLLPQHASPRKRAFFIVTIVM